MTDEKYVVFKRGEFDEWFDTIVETRSDSSPAEVPDAVVLRQQDVFCPAALDTYATSIMVAVSLATPGDTTRSLQKLADFFHSKAEESWHMNRKIPD